MPLQAHIHLAKTLGAAPELAPIYKWVVTDRLDIPVTFSTMTRSLTGKLNFYPLTAATGIVKLNNWNYTIKVQADFDFTIEQRVAQLKSLNLELLWFCDVLHANNNAAHTPDLKRVVLKNLGPFAPQGSGLPFYLVDVELEDASI